MLFRSNESIFCAKEKLQDCTIITYSDLVFEKAVMDQVIDFKGDIGIAVELDWKPHYNDRTLHQMSEADNVLFDKSLLEMQIDVFKKCNINDISIVTGYLADKITFPSINYFKNENYSTTAGNESIFCAKEKLQDCTIITYGDLVFEKAVDRKSTRLNSSHT